MLSIIAVIGKNRELGKKNHLLWHVPGDLPRFKKITAGHPVIMGRKTFQSIGHTLPQRTNIVISRNPEFIAAGAWLAPSLDEAVAKAKTAPGADEIFVIGGGQVYTEAIGKADRLYLTVVDAGVPSADTFFPDYSQYTKTVSQEAVSREGLRFTYITLER